MTLKIKIQKNDYKQPTEVRENVVQLICDYIISNMNNSNSGTYNLQINPHSSYNRIYELYIELRKFDGKLLQFWNERRSLLNQIRINGCEMVAVFDAIQDAGYFIFPTHYANGDNTYMFSKRPNYDNRRATHIKFTELID